MQFEVLKFERSFLTKIKKTFYSTYSKTPFQLASGDTTEVLLSRINEAKINFEDGNWKHVSTEAKVMNELNMFYSRIYSL